ncbi:MAG: radical SAM protein [Thermodesulfobacteriota bacterium]|nr:radical SAM protein [Thermodesulfobacteriota bacterium]
MTTFIAQHNPLKCLRCGWCAEIVACPGSAKDICIGCGACVLACPNEALELIEEPRQREITIEIDGSRVQVPEKISVKEALRKIGYTVSAIPAENALFTPCGVGACSSCAMEVNGKIQPTCVTAIEEGMTIKTQLPHEYTPRILVVDFMGHPVGGVGTPWQARREKSVFVEAVCLAAGCNLRCPQCYNWTHTYAGVGKKLTPRQAAEKLSKEKNRLNLNRMLISGGECTLNRSWLIQFIKELKKLNKDKDNHFHIQTNGSLITHDYIDELVDAGMTNIGIDLKGIEIDTFMKITGLKDRALSEQYKKTAWEAVQYIVNNYKDKVFVGVGIPYNNELISREEVRRMGKILKEIDSSIQVGVLHYMPDFRSRIATPEDYEMEDIRKLLKETGLQTVLAWTNSGEIGP